MKRDKIYIVGHRNPDSDSVCSSIALAYLLNKTEGKKHKYIPVIEGNLNKETKFILNKFKIKHPKKIKTLKNEEVILVDHNSIDEGVKGINQAKILGIVDHHRLSGEISTELPIDVEISSVGSTCTLVAERYFNEEREIPKQIAGILLGGILSDTILLKSPTTTKRDKIAVRKLSHKCGVNFVKFGKELLKQTIVDIEKENLHKLIIEDLKINRKTKPNFGIASFNMDDDRIILRNKKKILQQLEKERKRLKIDTLFLMAVNVVEFHTILFISGLRTPYQRLFKGRGEVRLRETVSRKKQVYPKLMDCIKIYKKKLKAKIRIKRSKKSKN